MFQKHPDCSPIPSFILSTEHILLADQNQVIQRLLTKNDKIHPAHL